MKLLSSAERLALFDRISLATYLAPSQDRIAALPGNTLARYKSAGYSIVRINGENYREHNCIYALHHGHWPVELVDHINNNKLDNRLENLRAASYSDNSCNRSMRSDNTLGYKGIFKRQTKTGIIYGWMIKSCGKSVSRSGFNTIEEAAADREVQLRIAHGDFYDTGK